MGISDDAAFHIGEVTYSIHDTLVRRWGGECNKCHSRKVLEDPGHEGCFHGGEGVNRLLGPIERMDGYVGVRCTTWATHVDTRGERGFQSMLHGDVDDGLSSMDKRVGGF